MPKQGQVKTPPAQAKGKGKAAGNGKARPKGKSKSAPEPALPTWPVTYPHLEMRYCVNGQIRVGGTDAKPQLVEGRGPLTIDDTIRLLHLETLEQYQERMRKENPGVTGTIDFEEDDIIFHDVDGKPVACWAIRNNRHLDMKPTRGYMQSQLTRCWAGPTCFEETETFALHDKCGGGTAVLPLGTVNGETIVVSRTGRIDSGQKRLVGHYLAWQHWQRGDRWQEMWPKDKYPKGPVLDAILVLGTSEDDRVVQTLDNVQPRSAADIVYTSPTFRDLHKEDRLRCSRILAGAVKVLWDRTWYGSSGNQAENVLTQVEMQEWLRRHPTLEQCVRFIWSLDAEHKLSDAGRGGVGFRTTYATAALYLMGACGSDEAEYNGMDQPGEGMVDWSALQKARQFWLDLTGQVLGDDGEPDTHPDRPLDTTKARLGVLPPVVQALAALERADYPVPADDSHRMAVVALAWADYYDGKPLTTEGLDLDTENYHVKKDDRMLFVNRPGFGGIDQGEHRQHKDTGAGDKDAAANLANFNKASLTKAPSEVQVHRPTGGAAFRECLDDLHNRFPHCLVVFRDDITCTAHGPDAVTVSQLLGDDAQYKASGPLKQKVEFPTLRSAALLNRLVIGGNRVALATEDGDKLTVREWECPKPTAMTAGVAEPPEDDPEHEPAEDDPDVPAETPKKGKGKKPTATHGKFPPQGEARQTAQAAKHDAETATAKDNAAAGNGKKAAGKAGKMATAKDNAAGKAAGK
jgi:hypothetical protein